MFELSVFICAKLRHKTPLCVHAVAMVTVVVAVVTVVVTGAAVVFCTVFSQNDG